MTTPKLLRIKLFCLVTLSLLLCNVLTAQVKSTKRAIIYSAILPGTGQLYLGNNTRGGVYLGTELLLLLSHIRLDNEIEWKENSYMLYAQRYADVTLNSDDNYYKFIANYISSDDYNSQVEQYYRNFYIIYRYNPDLYNENIQRYSVTGDEEWQWESRDKWLRYRELRREKQHLEILSNFAVGASILNRLVSVIDTALIGRSIRRDSKEDVSGHTSFLSDIYIEPDYISNGFLVRYQFRF